MNDHYSYYIKSLNKKNKGLVIYTGNPDFNVRYLAKRRTLGYLVYGKFKPNLATVEQEIQAKADYFEMIAEAGLPLLKKYFDHKKIRRANASKPRKPKPTKSELILFREKYIYDEGKMRGWIKAAQREFKLDAKTINSIINE